MFGCFVVFFYSFYWSSVDSFSKRGRLITFMPVGARGRTDGMNEMRFYRLYEHSSSSAKPRLLKTEKNKQ